MFLLGVIKEGSTRRKKKQSFRNFFVHTASASLEARIKDRIMLRLSFFKKENLNYEAKPTFFFPFPHDYRADECSPPRRKIIVQDTHEE